MAWDISFFSKKKEIVFQQAQKMDEMLNTENWEYAPSGNWF